MSLAGDNLDLCTYVRAGPGAWSITSTVKLGAQDRMVGPILRHCGIHGR